MRCKNLALRQAEGGGMFRPLLRWLWPVLVVVLLGGCTSAAGPTGSAVALPPAPAAAGPAEPGSPSDAAGGWSARPASTLALPTLFSHRLLVPPLQLVQLPLAGNTPTVLAAMQRFAAAAPAALEQRELLYAQTSQEPQEGWLTLMARSEGVDWVFGLQFNVDEGGRTLTLRLRTAGAANIANPQGKKMDGHISTLGQVVPRLFTD
ncbi:hypothetical protein [Achromobacter deleyi]|uniref:hypothetical protein n=1 Tax=Achromobacter deleyi TaxID=1353891 RepID=UPI0014680E47|nr:hypothetical protein [Achromobacter deleyi]CAB3928341.1 hypothetical protein LMG3412_06167 [Achromobacter deleyi]